MTKERAASAQRRAARIQLNREDRFTAKKPPCLPKESMSDRRRKPGVHAWAVVCFILSAMPLLLLCLWAAKDGWYPSERVLAMHPDPADNFYAFNQLLAVFSGAAALLATVPIWFILLGRRRPWAWTTMLVFIVMATLSNPLIGVPVLIFWLRSDNKAYYGHP